MNYRIIEHVDELPKEQSAVKSAGLKIRENDVAK